MRRRTSTLRVGHGCGLCNACRAPPPRARQHGRWQHTRLRWSAQCEVPREIFAFFHVPGAVHHLAMSNYSGVASIALRQPWAWSIMNSARTWPRRRAGKLQHARRVRSAPPERAAASIAEHDVGQDALVLEGASDLLQAKAVAVLEFEFIGRGYWRADKAGDQRLLKSVLSRLERYGYNCYWQGESGRLAPASGKYWCDAFQFRMRSNLVCSHLPDVLRTFDALA